jgi:hypothetical protein
MAVIIHNATQAKVMSSKLTQSRITNSNALKLLPTLVALSIMAQYSAHADEFSAPTLKPSQYDFGGVGLIQMPTARMSAEGEFNFGVTINEDYHHYNVSLQLFPWMETTFRYTQVPDMLFSSDPSFSGDTYYTDKGIDVKLRLLKESYWVPEVSVGFRDFGGTGLFDGEFVAMTKRFGPVDATVGVAWGYMGNAGNLQNGNKVNSVDCDRNTGYGGKGGTIDYERWFSGCS